MKFNKKNIHIFTMFSVFFVIISLLGGCGKQLHTDEITPADDITSITSITSIAEDTIDVLPTEAPPDISSHVSKEPYPSDKKHSTEKERFEGTPIFTNGYSIFVLNTMIQKQLYREEYTDQTVTVTWVRFPNATSLSTLDIRICIEESAIPLAELLGDMDTFWKNNYLVPYTDEWSEEDNERALQYWESIQEPLEIDKPESNSESAQIIQKYEERVSEVLDSDITEDIMIEVESLSRIDTSWDNEGVQQSLSCWYVTDRVYSANSNDNIWVKFFVDTEADEDSVIWMHLREI